MANNNSNKVKVTGYAKRTFFNSNIEYRDFSDDLVGLQLTSEGGTPLFTMGNFKITTNLSPKVNKYYNQGTYSFFYTLDNLSSLIESINIQKSQKAQLNLNLTDPLSYVWYGSSSELIRISLENLKNQFPAAIYVDNKVGSITGNNITNFSYDLVRDESTFTVNSRYFVNPFSVKYTTDSSIIGTEEQINPLRNLTLKYKSYIIEHNGISKPIIAFSGSQQTTNSEVIITVKGNPFPEITGLNISQYSFLNPLFQGSIQYFIKPNITKQDEFFASLNDLQTNLLRRGTLPKYTSTFSVPEITDEGVTVYTQKTLTFPILTDGYNLNFFDGIYITYLDELTKIGGDLDETRTDIMKRQYVADVITGFDTIPRGDGDNLVLDGAKATKLIRLYGVAFDQVKKYINGIKFAHVVTYGKEDNTPDSLVKDLADMLGLYTQFGSTRQGRIVTPFLSNLNLEQVDIILFRRLILNVAWMWKSKGARKAIEFLFRFIGAPELLVTFDEHIVIADKPLDISKIKKLLYLYTGSSDISNLPFDKNGFPSPLKDGAITIVGYTSTITSGASGTTTSAFSPIYDSMWFQKAGGWYRETGGSNSQIDINTGNNPHAGPYDGGSEYLQQFTKCPLPDFNENIAINVTGATIYENHFLNYNHGFVNGTSPDSEIYITPVESTNNQFIENCVDINFNIVNAPKLSGGTSIYALLCIEAMEEYERWLELIKEDCELIYSPEWYIVKQNYEVASTNYSQELVTAQCDENQSLEVCIDFKDIEIIENPCDNYVAQFLDSGFIIFLNGAGVEVTFDEFPQCCVAAGGQYYSYINDSGQESYFCAYESPCIGEPIGVTDENIILWEVGNINTLPDDIYIVDGNCYQQVSTGNWAERKCTDNINGYTNTPNITDYNDTVNISTFLTNNPTAPEIVNESCFVSVDCGFQTVESSIECCVYNGFSYQIVSLETGGSIIVCVPPLPGETPTTDGRVIKNGGVKLPTVKGYDEYVSNSNLNTPPKGAETIATKTSDVSGVYTKGVVSPTNKVSTDFGSNRNNPDLMDCASWEVAEIDQHGRISLKPIFPVDSIERLDWLDTVDTGADLYRECCTSKGYTYGTFIINAVTQQLILVGDEPISQPSWNACVDTNFVPCTGIKDLKLILGSNGLSGFYLPQTDQHGCDCELNIRFDYMVKYKPSSLIECANCKGCECDTTGVGIRPNTSSLSDFTNVESQFASDSQIDYKVPPDSTIGGSIPCLPTIFHDQTLDSLYCPDFITFVSSEEESNLLLNNFGSHENIKEEFVVWENDVIQLNPPVECCEALGGTVQLLSGDGNFLQYYSQQWKDIPQSLNEYINQGDPSIFPNGVDPSILSNITDYGNLLNILQGIATQDCVIPIGHIESYSPICDNSIFSFDVNGKLDGRYNYITTKSICSLIPPSDCMYWASLLFQANATLNWSLILQENLEDCVEAKTKDKTLSTIDRELITTQIGVSETKFTNKKLISDSQNKILGQQTIIVGVDKELSDINNRKTAINSTQSKQFAPIECGVYRQQINILNGFDVNQYCKNNSTTTTPEQEFNTYNNCVNQKTSEINNEKAVYEKLITECNIANESNTLLNQAKSDGNSEKTSLYTQQYNDALESIDDLTISSGCDIPELNSKSIVEQQQENNIVGNTKIISNILDVTPETLRSGPNITITETQNLTLNITKVRDASNITELTNKKTEAEKVIKKILDDEKKITAETNLKLSNLNTKLDELKSSKEENSKEDSELLCCIEYLGQINMAIGDLQGLISTMEIPAQSCYDEWRKEIQSGYDKLTDDCDTYLSFIDDLKINFTIEVDNNNIGTIPPSLTHYNLTTLPLTNNINPIWEFTPQNYSGVIIEGDEYDEVTVKDQITQELISGGFTGLTNIFEPQWQTLNFNIPTSICESLKKCYPDKQFFIGIEIENYECDVCLLIDNIQVNFNECDIVTQITTESCPMPDLKCIVDNRKSWVYSDKGIEYVNALNDGSCVDVEINCEEIAGINSSYSAILKTPQNRLWQNLEYRYTEYDFDHSDLIINTKSAAFKIDPAKAIECDVYNFWKNIECDDCPTSCDLSCYILTEDEFYISTEDGCTLLVWCDNVGDYISYNGVVRSATTSPLSAYTLTLSGDCDSENFSCETYTTLLETKVTELKDEYYTLSGDYNESLNATYADLKEKGGDITNFGITRNNCGSDTILIGNYKDVNELFGLMTEDPDGIISFSEIYIYDDTTPYTGGTSTEILSGYTGQTFNRRGGITEECCQSLNSLLNDTGKYGMGLGKNYVWNDTFSACTWRDLDNCQGDCSYTGPTTINSTTGTTILLTPSLPTVEHTITLSCVKCSPALFAEYTYTNSFGNTISGEVYTNTTTPTFCAVSGSVVVVLPFPSWVAVINSGLPCPATTPTLGVDYYNVCGNCYEFSGDTIITGTTETSDGEFIPFTSSCTDYIGSATTTDSGDFNTWMINNYCNSVFNDCFEKIICCETEEVDICVKPLDLLDIPPSKIQVKQVFDEMVRRNLINATNRQTISGYPTLRLFYHLYLVANNCGSELTGRLTYNNLFQFMDLIGDYWLELLEQVIPATTIMEGCDNSGKAYRNTIFDNNKFVYKKYALNYTNCCPTKVSPTAIGCSDVDIKVEELCINGDCMGQELEACNSELRSLNDKLETIQSEIDRINDTLSLPVDNTDIPCTITEDEITNLNVLLSYYQEQLVQVTTEIFNKENECSDIQANLEIQIAEMDAQLANCDTFSDQIQNAEEELLLLEVDTFPYTSKVNYIKELTEKYEKCIRLASTNVTNYNTVFITQTYNTNEYEGNVTVYGDDEWNESQELIRDIDCEEVVTDPEVACGRDCEFSVESCPSSSQDFDQTEGYSSWKDLGNIDCNCSGATFATTTVTNVTPAPFAGDIQTWDYGFNIPLGAEIRGVMVSIKRKQDDNTDCIFSDESVELMYAGNTVGVPNITQQGVPWDTNWETVWYGNSTDLWSNNWAPSQINSPTFGVRYLPQVSAPTVGVDTGYLDCITVTVKYFYDENTN